MINKSIGKSAKKEMMSSMSSRSLSDSDLLTDLTFEGITSDVTRTFPHCPMTSVLREPFHESNPVSSMFSN